MEDKFSLLKSKIEEYKEKNAGKKRIHYSESLKSEVASFLKEEQMSVSEFCKSTGFKVSTVNSWKKAFFGSKRSSKAVKKEPLFKSVFLRDERKKRVFVLCGLSLEEICELVGEL
ncbi:MAG: hypothetical protein GDA46_07445 [Bdellovibrionales bacterium]|nr:hypothetical protein [Bdellovibrionales bacterium]